MKSSRHDQIVLLLRQRFPEVAEQLAAQAELARQGMLILPGSGGVPRFVGDPPRWLNNPFNDAEYLWSLNRMEHWVTMLRGWAISGDERLPAKVVAELDDWIASVRPPSGDELDFPSIHERFNRITPWRMLEVGIRMYLSWSHLPCFLAGTRWFDAARAQRFADSLAEHGRILSKYSPILWPHADHNHFMMEMLGLLHVAILMPQLPEATAWREQALRELVRCCENQFTISGGQIEGCPHYHNVCLDVLARAVGVLRGNGLAVPAPLESALRAGINYMLQTTRPTGQTIPWGDSDPLLVAATAVYSAWAVGDPQSVHVATQLVGVEAMRSAIANAAWDIGEPDRMFAELDQTPRDLPPTMAWHKGLDQVSARTGWTRDSASVFFACRTPVNNAHAHIDPCGFDYTALGKSLLIDPGRFTYREDDDRRWFKSAAAHNTLTIDGREPFEYRSSWEFGPQRNGVIETVTQHGESIAIIGRHENYSPSIVCRTLILRADGVLVVLDQITPLIAGQKIQRWFHFNSTNVIWDDRARYAKTMDDDVNVAVYCSAGATASIVSGRISNGIDVAYRSQRLCLEDVAADTPFMSAAVILPFRGKTSPTFRDLSCTDTSLNFILAGEHWTWAR